MLEKNTNFSEDLIRPASAHAIFVGRGGDSQAVLSDWASGLSISPIDQVWLISDGRVTIEQVRGFQRDLLMQPVNGQIRLGILSRAHQLTTDAAHALLKLLEDPPSHAAIILGAEQEDQLLGTILSRCQRWRLRGEIAASNERVSVSHLRSMSYRERLKLAETWAKEDNWYRYLAEVIWGARVLFRSGKLSVKTIRQLVGYEQLASTNVTGRLLLENTLLALGKERV